MQYVLPQRVSNIEEALIKMEARAVQDELRLSSVEKSITSKLQNKYVEMLNDIKNNAILRLLF